MPSWVKWSPEEDAILEAVYPHHGVKGAAEVLNRKPSAIQVRAAQYVCVYVLPKDKRSKEPARQIADRIRTKFRMAPPAQPKATRKPGGLDEMGKTPSTKPGLKPVPDAVTNLPWVSYPRDPVTARAVAAACEFMAGKSDVVKKVGPEAQRFFESQAQYLRALADRMAAKVLA